MISSANEGSFGVVYDRPKQMKDRENNLYICTRYLAKGGFSKVYRLEQNRSVLYCGKFVPKQHANSKSGCGGGGGGKLSTLLLEEIEIHKSLKHANILNLYKCVEDKRYYCLILEYCDNKSLAELLKRRKGLTEPEIRYYMKQTLSGLGYLHRNNVVHRDIKPQNILLNHDMIIKIADFGLATKLARIQDKIKKVTIYGTPNYMSPEMVNNRVQEYNYRVDLWAVGVLLYDMFAGFAPFAGANVEETYANIVGLRYDIPSSMSKLLSSLVRRVLQIDPDLRPGLWEIQQDRFFSDAQLFTPKSLPRSALYEAPTFIDRPTGSVPETEIANILTKSRLIRSPPTPSNVANLFDLSTLGTRQTIRNVFCTSSCLRHVLRKFRTELLDILQKNKSLNSWKESELESPHLEPLVWISEYADCLDTSGECVAYVLSNDVPAAFYSDNVSISLLPDSNVQYYVPKISAKHVWKIKDCPAALKRKIRQLSSFYSRNFNHHRRQMQRQINKRAAVAATVAASDARDDYVGTTPSLVYFKDRSNYSCFLLSNGALQLINKKSKHAALLCPRLKAITLISRDKKVTYSINCLRRYGHPAHVNKILLFSFELVSRLLNETRCFICRRYIKRRNNQDETDDNKPDIADNDVERKGD